VLLTPSLPESLCLFGVLQVMSTSESGIAELQPFLHNFFPLTEEQATHVANLQETLGCPAQTAHLLLQLNCQQLPIEEAANRSANQYIDNTWRAAEQTFRRRYEFPPQLVQTVSLEGAPSSSTATPTGTPAASRQQGQPLGSVEQLLVVKDAQGTQAKPFFKVFECSSSDSSSSEHEPSSYSILRLMRCARLPTEAANVPVYASIRPGHGKPRVYAAALHLPTRFTPAVPLENDGAQQQACTPHEQCMVFTHTAASSSTLWTAVHQHLAAAPSKTRAAGPLWFGYRHPEVQQLLQPQLGPSEL
jgi:hypothetical protein